MANEIMVKPADRMRKVLSAETVREQFESALGNRSGQFIASLIEIYSSDPQLQKFEPGAIVKEALKAASLNLPIVRSLGFAYIVPFKNIPTFSLGYKGLIQLAQRTGQYKYINADVIYEGEEVRKDKLTGEVTIAGSPKSEKEIGYFAYIELLNGFRKTIYMSREEAESHGKRYSPSFGSSYSPWKSHFTGMAMKTCLRKLIGTYGYMSVEMQTAISQENEAAAKEVEIVDIRDTEPPAPAPETSDIGKKEPDF